MKLDAKRRLEASAGSRLPLIVESHLRLVGRPLVAGVQDLWDAPFALLAHGLEADPVFFYGNRLALELFGLTAEEILRMPSRLSAEPVAQAERGRLLDAVARDGFIDHYAGVRVSKDGSRFRIERAAVWNLLDAAGVLHGQAAAFAHWTPLDPA